MNIDPSKAKSRISRNKSRGVTAKETAARKVNSKQVDEAEFSKIYSAYEQALHESNLLDYDDLLIRCCDLLRGNPRCVAHVEAVLVDEFQDTNIVQFELMTLFAQAKKKITIVGDPDQSIYGFRSAEIKNLKRMRRVYPDTVVINLEDNYRSAASILAAAEDVILQDDTRPDKRLRATHVHGSVPVLRKLPSAAEEGLWIASEIERAIALTGGMLEFADFAILIRTMSLSRQIESALGKAGIPYRMVGGHRFFDREEIKLLLDYLRVLSHPENTDAVIRVINVPSRKVGDDTVKKLVLDAQAKSLPLYTFLRKLARGEAIASKNISGPTMRGIECFVGLIESGRKVLIDDCANDVNSPVVMLEFVIKKLGLKDWFEMHYQKDDEARWANVQELLAQAMDTSGFVVEDDIGPADVDLPENAAEVVMQHIGKASLTSFLANIALATEVTASADEQGQDQNNKVIISTIHASKGLEWPCVFIPSIYLGIMPHSRSEDHDEERRLLYVAMTRAKALLSLSYPRADSMGKTEDTVLSPFITPKMIEQRFRDKAPTYNDCTVGGIAGILGRSTPSQEDIYQRAEKLTSIRDDRWTTRGYAIVDGDTTTCQGWTAMPRTKPVVVGSISDAPLAGFQSAATYTMNNPQALTMPPREKSNVQRQTLKRENSQLPKQDNKRTKKATAPRAGGSITAFFTRQSTTTSIEDEAEPPLPPLPQRSSIYTSHALETSEYRADGPKIPAELSAHRLKPRVLLPDPRSIVNRAKSHIDAEDIQKPSSPSQPKKRYAWLSSSPPRPEASDVVAEPVHSVSRSLVSTKRARGALQKSLSNRYTYGSLNGNHSTRLLVDGGSEAEEQDVAEMGEALDLTVEKRIDEECDSFSSKPKLAPVSTTTTQIGLKSFAPASVAIKTSILPNTTMNMLRNQGKGLTTASPGAGSTARRTLGVRRSAMNGWEARMKR